MAASAVPHFFFKKCTKKTALRPFSFERTGGPPPSVVFAHSNFIFFGQLLLGTNALLLSKRLIGVGGYVFS